MPEDFDQEDPFKKYGGKEVTDTVDDPFKKYGGSSIEEPPKKKGQGWVSRTFSKSVTQDSKTTGLLDGLGSASTKLKEAKPKVEENILEYNKAFEEATGINENRAKPQSNLFLRSQQAKGNEILQSNLKKGKGVTQTDLDKRKNQQYKFIDETELKPLVSNVATGTTSAKQLEDLHSKPYGKKIVESIASEISPDQQLGWDEVAKEINIRNRPKGVEAQNQYVYNLDNEIANTIDGAEVETVMVSGGTGGAAANVSKFKLPQINTSSAEELGQVLSQIENADTITGKDGKPIDKAELSKKINERLFYLSAEKEMHPEIAQLSDKTKQAITRYNIDRERGENINANDFAKNDEVNQRHFELGLNFAKDARPGLYKNVIRGIEERGVIADTDAMELSNIGQQIYNQQIFKEGAVNSEAIGKETNLLYDSYQTNKAQYAKILSEEIKKMGYKNRMKIPQSVIDKAAAKHPELTNQEIIKDIKFSEANGGKGIVKGGWVNAAMRGFASPIKGIENTVEAIFDSPVDNYLNSKKFDRGDQVIPNKRGEYSGELPSEQGNLFLDIIEGGAAFVPQVFLTRGIGGALKAPLPKSFTAGTRGANITNYGGTAVSTFIQSYGDGYTDMLQKTGDPAKARLVGAIDGTMAGLFEMILPDTKIADKMKAGLKGAKETLAKDIMKVINEGGKAAAAKPFIRKFVTNVLEIEGKENLEEVGTTITDYATEAIFSPQTIKDRDLGNEIINTVKATTAAMAIPALLGGAGQARSQKQFGKSGLHTVSINSEEYKEALQKSLINGSISEEDFNKATGIIDVHKASIDNAPKRDAEGNPISHERQLEYAYQNTIQELAKQEMSGKDAVQSEPLQKKIDEADKVKRKIFYGEEIKNLPKEEPEEKPVSFENDNDLLTTIHELSGEGLQNQDLQFFVDQASNAPLQFKETYGDEITNTLLSKATTEQLTKSMEDAMNMGLDETVTLLDDIIAKREQDTTHSEKIVTPEGEATHIESKESNVEAAPEVAEGSEIKKNIEKVDVSGLDKYDGISKKEDAVEEYAKDKGIWNENIEGKYGEPDNKGAESSIWINKDRGVVVKSKSMSAYGGEIEKGLDAVEAHNRLFPDTKNKIIGFGRDGHGSFNVILEQPFVEGRNATKKEVDDFMTTKGFEKNKDGDYFNEKEGVLVKDLNDKNVFIDKEGDVKIIDSNIEIIKQPTNETAPIQEYVPKTKKEIYSLPEQERELAIDELIYGKHEINKDAIDRNTGKPVSLGKYSVPDFIKNNDISGNPIAADLLNKLSKHPYFNKVRLYVTDKLEPNVKGEAIVTADIIKVSPKVDNETLAHEMMHVLTSMIFSRPYNELTISEKNLRNGVNRIIKEFDPNLSYLDKALGKYGYQRSEYAKEIIAEAFVGGKFSSELNTKTVNRRREIKLDKSLIRRIIDKIIDFFGGDVIKTKTIQEKQGVVDALRDIFIKHGKISSERLSQINKPLESIGYTHLSNKSRQVDINAAINRMKESGFSDAEIKSEFEKRGIKYEPIQEATEETKSEPPIKEPSAETTTTEDSGTTTEEKTETSGEGTVPPVTPPKESSSKGSGRGRDKGVLTHLYEAENVPQESKEGFKREGLQYNTKSQKEAESVAKSVIGFVGIDEAVKMAESQTFDGDVNSLIFAEALNQLAEQEKSAKTPEEKLEAAKKFAEVGITYDKMARYGGRFNAAINYFYQKSPLGMVLRENANRRNEFNDWSKPKDKSWKEFFDDLMNEPEFKDLVEEKIKSQTKEEAKEKRKAKRKAISDAFDKAKFKGDSLKSAVLPPAIWNGAVEVMKQTFLAGESLVDTIQKGIDYIKANHKGQFEEDKFWVEWTERLMEMQDDQPKSRLTQFKEKLKKQIDSLNEQIRNKQRNPKGEKIELDDEAKKLVEQRDKLKDRLEEVAPMSEANWYQERLRVLDKFRKKLKGLSEKEKGDVIRKSYIKLVEKGALEYEDFRKIIGEVTGRAELTPEQADRLKELVQITNSVDEAGQKARDERTPEALAKFREAENKAGKAAKELQEMFQGKPDLIRRITSIMQLSTLGTVSLIANISYNIWNQVGVRLPIGMINSTIDLFRKKTEKDFNLVSGQVEFWKKFGLGAKESIRQIFTGLDRMDYIQKEAQHDRIRPFKSWRDLFGKQKLSATEKIDKILQGTVGIPAELVARFLNVGDKPQRFAAEGAQAAAFAKALGLKDMDYKLFIEFPREEAYRAYKAQGLSDEQAGQKADAVKEAIIREGQRSTFQQDNLVNDAISAAAGKIFKGKESGAAQLAKTLAVSPYIKIPSNAFWSFYNLLNPEVAILQAMVHKGKSMNAKRKGDYVKQRMQNREARYWLAHAIVGMASRAAVFSLVNSGVFTPSSDEDDSKKERDALSLYDRAGTFHINGMNISAKWFAQAGMLFNAIAKKEKDLTPEQRENQDIFWRSILGGMELDGLKELENGLLANSSSLAQSIGSGNFDRYLTNTVNMFANIVNPASVAQFNRAGLDEVPSGRGDNLLYKIDQQFAQRSPLYRAISGTKVDDKLDIWGQPIPRGGNRMSRMFGISKDEKTQFGRPIYEDYLRTGDSGFLPPAVLPTLNKEKLNESQYRDLQNRIGTERRNLVAPYINDMANVAGFKKKYSQLNDEQKKYVLTRLYDVGRLRGLELFYQDHENLRPKKETPDYLNEVQQEVFNSILELKKK